MKYYWDAFIRHASAFNPLSVASNMLEAWDKIDWPKESKLSITPELAELKNGTSLGISFEGSFETSTIRVDKVEYEFLKTLYHNQLCDVMLFDEAVPTLVLVLLRIRLQVEKVLESGADHYIKISGKCNFADGAIDSRYYVLDLSSSYVNYGMIEGFVTDAHGVALEGALAEFDRGGGNIVEASADKDGYYMLYVPAGTGELIGTDGGVHQFPEKVSITAVANDVIRHDLVALEG